jgi:hypothetical protein
MRVDPLNLEAPVAQPVDLLFEALIASTAVVLVPMSLGAWTTLAWIRSFGAVR